MDIPKALAEMYRVLLPGGRLSLTLHRPSFTWRELKSCRSLKTILFRLYVLLNGIFFHFSGKTLAIPFTHRVESCQTKRGMKLALKRCGFVEIQFGALDVRFLVEAQKPKQAYVMKPLKRHKAKKVG